MIDPPVPGAYALLIETGAAVALAVRGGRALLPPGRYLYCGSARGPGGIRARVARHLRPGKAPHWHVDRLTAAGRVRAVVVAPKGTGNVPCSRVFSVSTGSRSRSRASGRAIAGRAAPICCACWARRATSPACPSNRRKSS